jgi:hypothetical protein
MRRHVWLSTFLFAAVLSPVLLQTNTCAPSASARLSVLELRVGTVQGEDTIKGFNPWVQSYRAQLPESEGTAVLAVVGEDPEATIEVQHDGQLMPLAWGRWAALDVPMDTSELRIKVSVDTGRTSPYSWTYVVTINRGGSGTLRIDIDVEVTSDGGVYDAGAFEVQP